MSDPVEQNKPEPGQKPQKSKQQKPKSMKSSKVQKRPRWLRISLSTLRILLVPALCVIALYIGLYIGYVRVGGQEAKDVFDFNTWRHLYDLVFSE